MCRLDFSFIWWDSICRWLMSLRQSYNRTQKSVVGQMFDVLMVVNIYMYELAGSLIFQQMFSPVFLVYYICRRHSIYIYRASRHVSSFLPPHFFFFFNRIFCCWLYSWMAGWLILYSTINFEEISGADPRLVSHRSAFVPCHAGFFSLPPTYIYIDCRTTHPIPVASKYKKNDWKWLLLL